MSKKCEKCGAPIEGFLAKLSGLMGVKKSETDPNKCNKCASNEVEESAPEPIKEPQEESKTESFETNQEEEEAKSPEVEINEPIEEKKEKTETEVPEALTEDPKSDTAEEDKPQV